MAEPTSKKKAPVPVPAWDVADAVAMQALRDGIANAEQQKRVLNWIINSACLTNDFCDKPENERLSAIFDGRRFAGLQIVKLATINLAHVTKRS